MDQISIKKGSVKRQVVLPFMKSVEIALKSIQARLLRSLITTVSLILAVSFLCFTHVTNDIVNSLTVSQDRQLQQALTASGYDIDSEHMVQVENSPKQKWIVALSLLVCVVGIVNSQLMAVTERFREIGTMKCLGALDHFIVRLFLLEALMQGIAGSLVGALVGTLSAFMAALFQYGAIFLTLLPSREIFLSMAITVATGCCLSLAGVLYPVIVAAGMQPVDAMRMRN